MEFSQGVVWCLLLLINSALLSQDDLVDPGPWGTQYKSEIFIRSEKIKDNRLVVLADPDRIVQMLLTPRGEILDCSSKRKKDMALQNIVKEASEAEEHLNLPGGVEYLEAELDLGWYARHCRRIIRNKLRDAEFAAVLSADVDHIPQVVDRQWLQTGIKDTNFCSRRPVKFLPIEENLGENRALDQCCLQLAECGPEEIGSLEYKHELLNADLFPIHHCTCMQAFLSCLQAVRTQEADRLAGVWLEAGRCFRLESRERCWEYDTWFTSCRNGTVVQTAVLHQL